MATTTQAAVRPVKKSVKKAEAKKAPAPKTAAKKEGGLRKPQLRILKCLAKSSKGLTRKEISDKAPVDQAACVEYLGSHDDSVRLANDKKHFPSLVTLGFVKAEQHEGEAVTYSITAKGKAEAAKA